MLNTPPAAVGIDIGKTQLHVCTADAATPPAKWPVVLIEYADPRWYERLHALIPDGAVVAAEPTGWHYFQPLVTVLQDRAIWQVNHQMTAAVRKTHLSRAKTDSIDARALALIATLISQDNPPRGCRPYHHDLFIEAHALRLILNERRAAEKLATRLTNQLDAMAHSVWPACAIHRDAFLSLFEEGIPTADLKTAAQDAHTKNRRARGFQVLAADLPAMLPVNPHTMRAIAARVPQLRQAQAQLDQLDQELAQALTSQAFAPIAARLLTVPCMSLSLIAAVLVATGGNPAGFTISQFKAAIGFHPTNFSSGNTDHARRTKSGYRTAKKLLYMLAQALVNPKQANPANPIARYYSADKKNISACRRKLTGMLWAIASREQGCWPATPADQREMSARPGSIAQRNSQARKRAAAHAPILEAAARASQEPQP